MVDYMKYCFYLVDLVDIFSDRFLIVYIQISLIFMIRQIHSVSYNITDFVDSDKHMVFDR